VKEHAKRITKRSPAMRAWKENGQRTIVSSMSDGDFFANEQSHIMPEAGSVKITLHQADGATKVLLSRILLIFQPFPTFCLFLLFMLSLIFLIFCPCSGLYNSLPIGAEGGPEAAEG
jgi:hypothetical protein